MPHSKCFLLNCGRRIPSNQKKYLISIPQLLILFRIYVGAEWKETDKTHYICKKCHLKLRCKEKDSTTKNFLRTKEPVIDSSLVLEARTRSKRTRSETFSEPHPSTSRNNHDETSFQFPSQATTVSQPPTDPTPINSPMVISSEGSFQVDSQATTVSQPDLDEPRIVPPPIISETTESQQSEFSEISSNRIPSSKAILIPRISTVASSQKMCFICRKFDGRKRIPKEAISQVWDEKVIMIPDKNRCCEHHFIGKVFTPEAMELIISTRTGVIMTDEDLANWILRHSGVRSNKSGHRRYNFDDPTDVKSEEYPTLVGWSKIEFDILLLELAGHVYNTENRSVRNALAIFLMLLHQNLTQSMLSSMFGIKSQSSISETIQSVALALDKSFTKRYLGFGSEHLSRDSALKDHSRKMYYDLFEEPDPSKLFLIMDATYVYIEKATDTDVQKMTFSGQKKRNLVKPFMIVLPSGYILDAAGPYFANGANNDAGILKSILARLPSDSPWLKEGDHHVLDRGFRDVIQNLEKLDISTHMPALMDPKAKQFTTQQGNESRRVTLVRWLVEAVNGRIKKKFRFFRDTVSGGYIEKIGLFFRIACAILNRFSPLLSTDSPRHDRIAERALLLVDKENTLKIRVEEERMDRNTKSWRTASCSECEDFPLLSLDDLETLTLGVYQSRLAKQYAKRHLQKTGEFDIKLNDAFENIVRARIGSRFTGGREHNVWIEYAPNGTGIDGITGYYCHCKQGARTMGCCAHVGTVIWYMGYQRHQIVDKQPKRRRDLNTLNVKDAAERMEVDGEKESDNEEVDSSGDEGEGIDCHEEEVSESELSESDEFFNCYFSLP